TPAETSAAPQASSAATPSSFQDAVASLITLGYKAADADKLVRKASSKASPDASVEDLIRLALS
ncbi:MAG: Holliday junction branch migration protein RuvA, partial [Coraliomargarita sp.]